MLLRSLLCSAGALLASASGLAQDLSAPTSRQLAELGTTAGWERAGGAESGAIETVQVSRPGFKAELSARGFEMTPFRGAEAARSLPWAWTQTEVRRGDQAFDATTPTELGARQSLAWLARESWSERYELGAEGIEQSFLFHALPGDGGDLVVRGAIRTELRAEKRAAQHAELRFADERGEIALTYGSAFAIDARGRRLELASSFDGTHLEIRIDAAWLAEATLPLLVDPLIAGTTVPGAFSGSALRSTCVALDGESSSAQWLVGVVRAFSATDLDLAAYLCDTGFANPRLVYLDANTATSDHSFCAAYLPGADRWIFAYQRDFAAAGGVFSSVRLIFHDRQSTAPGTGAVVSLAGNPTHSYSAPQIAGGSLQNADLYALLTFQSDATTTRENTASSLVRASFLDAVNRTAATPIDLAPGRPSAGFDRERPSVIGARFFQGEQWVCVWTERPTQAGGKAKLVGTYVNPVGAAQSVVDLYTFPGTRHVTRPLVAGMIDHYVVVFGGTQDLAQTEA
ncbi:MAG: hypothetical protein JNM84_24135, partial [Planctomycetes bacterium]|nr:hypothetical protein [Planctomycetota bacterium]